MAWDSLLLDLESKSALEFSRQLDKVSNQQIAQWQSASVLDWAKESKALRSQVYSFSPTTQSQRISITQSYIDRSQPIIERRLLMAGVRLAACLNQLFDPLSQGQKQ